MQRSKYIRCSGSRFSSFRNLSVLTPIPSRPFLPIRGGRVGCVGIVDIFTTVPGVQNTIITYIIYIIYIRPGCAQVRQTDQPPFAGPLAGTVTNTILTLQFSNVGVQQSGQCVRFGINVGHSFEFIQ